MKWGNHAIVTASAAYALTGSAPLTLCCFLGSVLPDAVEGRPPSLQKNPDAYNKWRANHRKLSHWYPLYLIPFLGLIFYVWLKGVNLKDIFFMDSYTIIKMLTLLNTKAGWDFVLPYIYIMIAFIFLGGVLHLAEDFICGGIPSTYKLNKRMGIRLFKVGTIKETAIVSLLVVGFSLAGFYIYGGRY